MEHFISKRLISFSLKLMMRHSFIIGNKEISSVVLSSIEKRARRKPDGNLLMLLLIVWGWCWFIEANVDLLGLLWILRLLLICWGCYWFVEAVISLLRLMLICWSYCWVVEAVVDLLRLLLISWDCCWFLEALVGFLRLLLISWGCCWLVHVNYLQHWVTFCFTNIPNLEMTLCSWSIILQTVKLATKEIKPDTILEDNFFSDNY